MHAAFEPHRPAARKRSQYLALWVIVLLHSN